MWFFTTARRKSISAWVQYFYFLRIPIMGWFLLPTLCLLDWRTGVSALTRGIMTMGSGWQAFYGGFFITSMGMATLVCFRNIIRNGRDRFDSQPPIPLFRLYCSRKRRSMWTALALAHVPTVLTLTYTARVTAWEQGSAVFGPHYGFLLWDDTLGVAASVVFWYLVSLFYLWTYPNTGEEKPAAAIFPGDLPLFKDAMAAQKPLFAVWAEEVTARLLPCSPEGYRSTKTGLLRELHFLTTVALAGFLVLYLMLYPMTAPVYFSRGILDRIVAIVLFAFCVWGARRQTGGWDWISYIFLIVESVFLILFLVVVHYDSFHRAVLLETAFPALASILVIVIFLQWFLAGATFFLDRYRAPVLSVMSLVIFLPKFLPVDQDHYFDAVQTSYIDVVDSPLDALNNRTKNLSHPDEPLIIVTATGGGIQAAAWTANVMAQLETSFNQNSDLQHAHYTFHEHLLMASGVSGGSVGLMPFLLEYTANNPFYSGDKDLMQRITKPAECSSLEAVAWGLEYYDFQRLLLTYRPSSLQYDSSDFPNMRAGETLPFFPDRTWALTRAFNRNLKDLDCGTAGLLRPDGLQNGEQLTLGQAAGLLHRGSMPVFTFNTTVAESGGRFLLSNYDVPPMPPNVIWKTDFIPAKSFLKVYTQEPHCDAGTLNGRCYADIAMSTAARLSATFPLVSSATRIPPRFAGTASHFLDGGYYDNDGTASVAEFLYSIMEERDLKIFKRNEERSRWEALKEPRGTERDAISYPRPLRILLIEIRDGVDVNPATNLDDWAHQTGATVEHGSSPPSKWGIFHQILAPVEGLWNAGHVSTTLRNRQQLCVLERAYANRKDNSLQIHHVVLGIPPATVDGKPGEYSTPPLSWKLTNRQIQYIRDWLSEPRQEDDKRKQTMSAIQEGINWVNLILKKEADEVQGDGNKNPNTLEGDFPTCELVPQTFEH